jgi:DNA-binding NarL/FixJ family response regulator
MRRWYAAAVQRIAPVVEESASGWELLLRMAEDDPVDLVIASRSLPGLTGAQVLSMLRAADAQVPFILIAPFSDGSVRSLVSKLRNAALVDDSLDAVRLAETAQTLLAANNRPREVPAEKVRRAVALCARARRVNPRRALG